MQDPIDLDPRRLFSRKFVPMDADMGDWAQIEPLFKVLLHQKPASIKGLEKWLLDRSELTCAILEEGVKRYFSMTTQTDDPVREHAYQRFIEDIEPRIKPLSQKLDKAYHANQYSKRLPAGRYAIMDRMIENRVALFRQENVSLETKEALLAKDYLKLTAAMMVTVNGTELTLEQASKYLEEPDRSLRQQVWELIAARHLQDKKSLETLYDQLITLRGEIAANAGFSNYRDYAFRKLERFDYTPEDCFHFHEAVERAVVPISRKILHQRKLLLGVEPLRPWDLSVDPLNRPPLQPFSTVEQLIQGAHRIFSGVDAGLGDQFRFMAEEGLLELESRKGKAPGGYQETLHERRWPLIFMNSVGSESDIRILLHEGGHAFHMLAAREEPLLSYRETPMEFSEVASMSMELLGMRHLDAFYKNPEAINRAYRAELEGIVTGFLGIATGDAFQHWVYTHPTHTLDERMQAWKEIHARFFTIVTWEGYEEQLAVFWHRILHFFVSPFYFIEYGIAQIGALQVWMHSRTNYREAVIRYRKALALGGSRPLPELFDAAGARFKFDYETLKPLMDTVGEELDRIGN